MKGDFTRFTHRPARQYAGVLMQQGRVQLDADWNEQVELSDQRWRTQTVDTIGACGVPADAPGYGQLGAGCPTEITTGAEDGAEMGAFNGLRQPQRETNLRIRLDEYLPFGLHPALIYMT